jgi:ribosomal protein S18 acetylase RimI-like enzyme
MAVLARSRENYFGLREMNPLRDLGQVADLIEEAFSADLDQAGQNALRELRWLSRMKPLLWWMLTFNPAHTDFLSGFVWEEDGNVVGNITVNQTSSTSQRWLISNVAVSKNYRERGIARSLMDAGMELARESHGNSISLQVRADNVPARRLYDSLGFDEISGTTFLALEQIKKSRHVSWPTGVTFRPRRFTTRDTRSAYNLACAATPILWQREWPIRRERFDLNFSDYFNNLWYQFLGGQPCAYWVAEEGRRFVGMVNIFTGLFGKEYRIELFVHPDWRGVLEPPLISRALAYIYPRSRQVVRVKHSADHGEAIEAFKSFGFKEEQTLVWMKIEI